MAAKITMPRRIPRRVFPLCPLLAVLTAQMPSPVLPIAFDARGVL